MTQTILHRTLLKYLTLWKDKPHRKPLVLRGARQVGKSWLVREFARSNFKNIIEINLEKNPEDGEILLKAQSVEQALTLLSVRYSSNLIPSETLLFLDEIQSKPELISKLRYLHEDAPELHVIAAGSLLEFALSKADFSMPVGRVEYCHIGPLTFTEFLMARRKQGYVTLLEQYQFGDDWPDAIHKELLAELRLFWVTGGMPEVLSTFINQNSLLTAEEIKTGIVSTYRDDFAKYRTRINLEVLRKVYGRAPLLVGQRAKYVEYDRLSSAQQIRHALDLLSMAQVLSRVKHTNANGLPLGAEANEDYSKYLFVDIGLLLSLCGLNAVRLEQADDLTLVNRGALAEQFIGQHLLRLEEPFIEPVLYYWERHERNSSAELDFVISVEGEIVPVEVKSGSPGRMKSLQLFIKNRRCKQVLRFSTAKPLRETLASGATLLSLPLYMVEQSKRLLKGGDA